jgi:hypothetical protein
MSKPVKLSDSLYGAAREAADVSHRSLSSQIEHWATLGRAIEGRLTSNESAQLKSQVREPAAAPYATAGALQAHLKSALLEALKPTTQAAFAAELAASPLPRYSADPAFPGCLVLENPDGTRTPGTWINGRFEPLIGRSESPAADARQAV